MNKSYSEAIETFAKLIADKSLGNFALLMTGRCYQKAGDSDLAEKAYAAAGRQDPDSKLLSIIGD